MRLNPAANVHRLAHLHTIQMASLPQQTSADLSTNPAFFALLTQSYERLVGKPLVPRGADVAWLYRDAPFAVLAHDTSADPCFIYANKTAQARFGYSWEEFLAIPSRLSAEPQDRAERQALLDAVSRDGFHTGYRGVRVGKGGRRFLIEDGVVWELIDPAGTRHGQAATFATWRDIGV